MKIGAIVAIFGLVVVSALALTLAKPAHIWPIQQPPSQPQTQVRARASAKHTVTVTFNYDFSKTPACSATVKSSCVTEFNVYDVSAGDQARTKMFSVPAPAGETKSVKGITGKSPLLAFEPGKHKLAVTAEMANGKESSVEDSTTWVVVPPGDKQPAPPAN